MAQQHAKDASGLCRAFLRFLIFALFVIYNKVFSFVFLKCALINLYFVNCGIFVYVLIFVNHQNQIKLNVYYF